ncbi:MAG: hypothetical protein OXB93_05390 [Cytophagales bacterium]|nr:hypothetical protein [Cytophagales bacterium]
MMLRHTRTYLKKIEGKLKEQGFLIRYERGNFESGFCVLKNQKVLLLSRFLSLSSQIEILQDFLSSLCPEIKNSNGT